MGLWHQITCLLHRRNTDPREINFNSADPENESRYSPGCGLGFSCLSCTPGMGAFMSAWHRDVQLPLLQDALAEGGGIVMIRIGSNDVHKHSRV